MERLFKKKQLNSLFYREIIAQPLDLRESLRIRDGIAEQKGLQLKGPRNLANQLQTYDLRYFTVCNN